MAVLSSTPNRTSKQGHWSSRLAFILAVTGSAVGLGNIWRFPYMVGENGGGAFVLVYLACILAIGLPIMMAEILIGRRARHNPITAMAMLGEEAGSSRRWGYVGGLGVAAGFLILSFYSVIAGWALAYVFESGRGMFSGADLARVEQVFGGVTASWVVTGFWHTVFMILTVAVVARGVQRGLERAVRVLVPALVAIMVVLLGYAIFEGAFAAGVRFLFEPDFSELTGTAILAAMGQAFFTLSLGMGAVMAYGAYLPANTSIGSTSISVVLADTGIALLAGLVIFPVVFAHALDPAAGPGLVFLTLPLAFGNIPGGVFFGTLFFILLSFAAWTSAISLIEPAVAWLTERLDLGRPAAAVTVGTIIWLLGIGSVLSFNVLAEFTFAAGTVFDNLDFLTNNVMLPLGGLLIVLFAAWVLGRDTTRDELALATPGRYAVWLVLARYVAPLAVLIILLHAIGLFGAGA